MVEDQPAEMGSAREKKGGGSVPPRERGVDKSKHMCKKKEKIKIHLRREQTTMSSQFLEINQSQNEAGTEGRQHILREYGGLQG